LLTPTYLKFKEQAVLKPDFHHLFKRVRDRLNAVCTFFGPGPIDADFKALGDRAEQVRTVKADVRWLERSRRSSKTGQRHELSGFVGECTYELPPDEPEVSNLELLKWLLSGEPLHAGRHTAWGNGWYVLG
jgi:CRISPR/Cas system endoribonuclease Cas6 (RAMP superfamily)